jgi:hypothetical protein
MLEIGSLHALVGVSGTGVSETADAARIKGAFHMRAIFSTRTAAVALALGIMAAGCSQSPVAPSTRPAVTAPTATGAANGSAALMAIGQANLTAADLEARGWDCRPVPFNPIRVVCSPPNQLHPVLLPGPPPPEDRPASITLLDFENGVFAGTLVLIRSDLYRGQRCSSTGDVYTFIARTGYYECRHQSKAS